MTEPPTLRARDLFDEAGYLRLYPGLLDALAKGVIESAWDHYGRTEGRRPNDVDPAFYLRTYPWIADELGHQPAPDDAAAHYLLYGRGRGYLPNAAAPRPADPTAVPSRFGGLWPDQQNAYDLIQGRRDLGRITARQADLLRHWVRDGFVVLDSALSRDAVEATSLDIERGFAGACPDALFDCPALSPEPIRWAAEMASNPASLRDIHHFSRPVREAILAPAVTSVLGLLFDSPVLLTGSRGFLRDPTTGPLQDSAIAGFSPPRHFVSAWIALEDADPAAGAPFVCPGSHRLPDFLFAGRYKSMQEARRAGHADLSRDSARHAAMLAAATGQGGFETRVLRPDAGSVVIRHPDLVHGGTPPDAMATRRGLAARLCPRYAMPLYAEPLASRRWPQDGNEVMSGVYPDLELLD